MTKEEILIEFVREHGRQPDNHSSDERELAGIMRSQCKHDTATYHTILEITGRPSRRR